MDAASFDQLFQRLVVQPATSVGFEPWGKGLWFERDGLRAALLRTELRNTWPFAFTLAIGHTCLRDFEDRVPPSRSRNPSEYPIKVRPSQAIDLVRSFRYEPWNLGRYPEDVMDDATVEAQLEAIGVALVASAPDLRARLSPSAVLDQLLLNGENAWCEQRWIDDYRAYLSRTESGGLEISNNTDLYATTERIIERLDSTGRADLADSLRAAMAGSTSGEIFADLRAEFERLLATDLRDDSVVGASLREAHEAINDALRPAAPRGWFRWLHRR